ncbi:MAG: PHP domain-containing protein [Polyangiaceae bacterium]
MITEQPLDRFWIAERLREISDLVRIRDEEYFPSRTYRRAAETLEATPTLELERRLHEGSLEGLAYVGPVIAEQIVCFATSGRSALLDELRRELPRSLLELHRVRGMSLEKAKRLRAAIGVSSVDDLARACEEGRVRTVRGFGLKTEQSLARAVEDYRRQPDHVRHLTAVEIFDAVSMHLARERAVLDIWPAGEIRRGLETTGEIGLVCPSSDPARVIEHFGDYPLLARIVSTEDSASARVATARLASGVSIRVAACVPERAAETLFTETGPALHVLEVRARMPDRSAEERHASDEVELYRRAGMRFVEPEVRDDPRLVEERCAVDAAPLVRGEDILGAVHCHTTHSDGRETVFEMARRAKELGFAYITITDHSPSAHYASGVPIDRLRAQWDEIAEAEEKVGIRVFRGTESDILADGALDYPDSILEQLDVVIASIHSRHRMTPEAMTERIVRCMQLPCFKIWGHPLGRLILRRPPIQCDVARILDVVAASNAAIEINGDPYRLDLAPEWARLARRRGIRFVLSSDAHSTRGLESVRYAVRVARRSGLAAADILNTSDREAFAAAVAPTGIPRRPG